MNTKRKIDEPFKFIKPSTVLKSHRFPIELYRVIEKIAVIQKRSVAQEIFYRLEASLRADKLL